MLERTIYHGGFKQRKDARIDNAHIMPSYRGTESTSLMARLKARECEYCGAEDNLRMVHVRKLKRPERQTGVGTLHDCQTEKKQ